MEKRYQSFDEFWPFYLSQHSNHACRSLHLFGTTLAFFFLIFCLSTARYALIPLVLVFGYGFSWIGHFFYEKNKPATFTYPKWSFFGDLKMLKLILSGRIKEELKKHNISYPTCP